MLAGEFHGSGAAPTLILRVQPRFESSSFSGHGFFVTHTLLDHSNECGDMNRLCWAQLLLAPRHGESLCGVLVSGFVRDQVALERWARKSWPADVRVWAVTHAMDAQKENELEYHNNFCGNKLWGWVNWKPKVRGLLCVRCCLCSSWVLSGHRDYARQAVPVSLHQHVAGLCGQRQPDCQLLGLPT